MTGEIVKIKDETMYYKKYIKLLSNTFRDDIAILDYDQKRLFLGLCIKILILLEIVGSTDTMQSVRCSETVFKGFVQQLSKLNYVTKNNFDLGIETCLCSFKSHDF